MTIRLSVALACAACLAGCTGGAPRDAPRGARCERLSEPVATLDLKDAALQRHLREDARAAEAFAASYADAMEIDKVGQHRQAMERCEGALLDDIARVHHVAAAQVRVALGRQNDTPF